MDNIEKTLVLIIIGSWCFITFSLSKHYTDTKICELKSGVMVDNKCLVDKVEVK